MVSNDPAQLPGRLERLDSEESRDAGPVRCSGLFDLIYLERHL
jgi:hypothetical protein